MAYLLMEAWELYSGTLCSGCGQSAMHAHDPDNSAAFEGETFICYGCAAAELASKDRPAPGEHVSVTSWVGDADALEEEYGGHHLPPGSVDIDAEIASEPPAEDGDLDG